MATRTLKGSEEAFRYLRGEITDKELKSTLKDGIEDAMTFGEAEVEIYETDIKSLAPIIEDAQEGGYLLQWAD